MRWMEKSMPNPKSTTPIMTVKIFIEPRVSAMIPMDHTIPTMMGTSASNGVTGLRKFQISIKKMMTSAIMVIAIVCGPTESISSRPTANMPVRSKR